MVAFAENFYSTFEHFFTFDFIPFNFIAAKNGPNSSTLCRGKHEIGCFGVSPEKGPRKRFPLSSRKNLNASRPSEHPCKYKTSSWHLNGFPDGSGIGQQYKTG